MEREETLVAQELATSSMNIQRLVEANEERIGSVATHLHRC